MNPGLKVKDASLMEKPVMAPGLKPWGGPAFQFPVIPPLSF